LSRIEAKVVRRSSQVILTTHTGSLPRPLELIDGSLAGAARDEHLKSTVFDVVQKQREAGIDVVGDGEMSKPSFVHYVRERLAGFDEVAPTSQIRFVDDFPGYREWFRNVRADFPQAGRPAAGCVAPLGWKNKGPLLGDIANLIAARDAVGADEAFLPSASVGIIAQRLVNLYYSSYEKYVEAIADVMHKEYCTIVDSGLILQIDAPEMCIDRNVPEFADQPLEVFRSRLELWVDALNHALQGIDEERVRLHICWGNEEAPHTRDVGLAEILDIVLRVKAGAYSIEAANPRHAHDWHLWEDTKLPDGKLLIPGVIDTTTNFVEHPQLVADRIVTYAKLLGRENIQAGTDCGFATTATFSAVYHPIIWAKLSAMSEGARLATAKLWA
jgi:5-methyltetrahydropteroyltriglutamate--homocysteine methyltransferase